MIYQRINTEDIHCSVEVFGLVAVFRPSDLLRHRKRFFEEVTKDLSEQEGGSNKYTRVMERRRVRGGLGSSWSGSGQKVQQER